MGKPCKKNTYALSLRQGDFQNLCLPGVLILTVGHGLFILWGIVGCEDVLIRA
jgi:hypothetical protein